LWTPIALAVAIGLPAVLFYQEPNLQRLALVAGAAIFALALVTLGVGWALGNAPRARRIVVLHVVIAGGLVALIAPFLLKELLAAVANYETAGAGANFTLAMSLALVPLALVLGLPISLASGIIFAWIALARPQAKDDAPISDEQRRHDVQPFR